MGILDVNLFFNQVLSLLVFYARYYKIRLQWIRITLSSLSIFIPFNECEMDF